MSECYVGSIVLWSGTFVPRGWALCDGSLVNISENELLYSLIGTTYGGNGQTNFALPNLIGRFPRGTSSTLALGAAGGSTDTPVPGAVTLTANNLPEHTHPNSSFSIGSITTTTKVQVSTDQTNGSVTPTAGAMLSSTRPASQPAAGIYLPTTGTLGTTVNLGEVATSVSGAPQVTVSPQVTGNTGTSPTAMSFTGKALNQPPSLTLSYIICLYGLYPPRN